MFWVWSFAPANCLFWCTPKLVHEKKPAMPPSREPHVRYLWRRKVWGGGARMHLCTHICMSTHTFALFNANSYMMSKPACIQYQGWVDTDEYNIVLTSNYSWRQQQEEKKVEWKLNRKKEGEEPQGGGGKGCRSNSHTPHGPRTIKTTKKRSIVIESLTERFWSFPPCFLSSYNPLISSYLFNNPSFKRAFLDLPACPTLTKHSFLSAPQHSTLWVPIAEVLVVTGLLPHGYQIFPWIQILNIWTKPYTISQGAVCACFF